jgi:hypothetical protein
MRADAIGGFELIFPVVFKTAATSQYAAIREFKRIVRLALKEHGRYRDDNQI